MKYNKSVRFQAIVNIFIAYCIKTEIGISKTEIERIDRRFLFQGPVVYKLLEIGHPMKNRQVSVKIAH